MNLLINDLNKTADFISEHGVSSDDLEVLQNMLRKSADTIISLQDKLQEIQNTSYELNPDGLPCGLTISEDGNLLNWRGENYVRQSTLGGKLTAEQVREAIKRYSTELLGGSRLFIERDWPAIADELNAAIGGGECEWVWVESWTDTTDGRECDYAHWMPDCGCWSEYDRRFSDFDDYEEKPTGIAFCERCGKAVKR